MRHALIWGALLAFLIGGCTRPVEPVVESPAVMVSPTVVTLMVGAADTLTALLKSVGNQDRTLDRSSADTAVAQIAKLLPADQAVIVARKAGSTIVVVRWHVDLSVGAMAQVTVR